MWNLLSDVGNPISGSGMVYRPTGSSGFATNPAYAYDLPGGLPEAYPYSTSADRSQRGGSPTNVSGTWISFPTLAKSAIPNLYLNVVADVTCIGAIQIYGGIANAAVRFDVSYDGGTIWHVLQDFSNSYHIRGVGTYVSGYPANSVSDTEMYRSYDVAITKNLFPYILTPSLLTTGLQDLQFRATTSSITLSTLLSTSGYKIWDISAVVS